MKQSTVIVILWLILGAVLVFKSKSSPLDWLKESKEVIIDLMRESNNDQKSE